MNFTVCSYNCCSLSKNIEIVRDLTNKCYDIIFLQETMVTENRLGDLSFIDENYDSIGSASVYSEKALESCGGRSEGGLACLWRKDASFKIDKVVIEKNYIVMTIKVNSLIIVLVNVYLRSDIWEIRTLNDYLNGLSDLESIINTMRFDSIYFLGDFNADPFSGRAWGNLMNFVENNSLRCIDREMLIDNSFTFIAYGNGVTKWLDHVIGRDSTNVNISNTIINYDMIGSDHLPILAHFNISSPATYDCGLKSSDSSHFVLVNWDKLDNREIKVIDDLVLEGLSIFRHCDVMSCMKVGCRNHAHLEQLSDFYEKLCNLVSLGRANFVRQLTKRSKYVVIPGWNRNVKNLYAAYREYYLIWLRNGKPRNGGEFDSMKEKRMLFKNALNECKLNEVREVSLSIQEKFMDKDMKSFWRNVQRRNNKTKYSEIIDGKNKCTDVIQIFNDKFLKCDAIFNVEEERSFIDELKNIWLHESKFNVKVSPERLRVMIKQLSNGEGHDKIHALFLRKMSDELLLSISNFMNACYSHCCIPGELLSGDINPTIKDPKGNATESTNYRPVMQSSCILKLFEMHILDILTEKVFFNSRQFGFRKQTSTTDSCLMLKETVNKYINDKNDRVHSLFVDLSKAFDNVDHIQLGQLLLKRKLPPDIVLFLMHYLRNQRARIVWKGKCGDYFQIEKGVRQGGILSPFLFKLYIDDILHEICDSDIGCKLGLVRINVLAYADDIVLIASTQNQLAELYSILSQGMIHRKLSINKRKTKCMIFRKHFSGSALKDDVILAGDTFEVVSEYKYLGYILQDNLSDVNDVKFRLNSFYAKFNWVFRTFKNVSMEVLYFLFKSFCTPDYGLSMWNTGEIVSRPIFKTFVVAFSNALKKILNVPIASSSHAVAETFNQLLFIHFVTFNQVRYFKRIFKSCNPLLKLSIFNLKQGYLFSVISRRLRDEYRCDILSNDLDILKARINWVQNHEPRTGRALTQSN